MSAADEGIPTTPEDWVLLRKLDRLALLSLGCKLWSSESRLLLFPVAWYEHIPEGFVVVNIFNAEKPFSKETHSKDSRVGALAYGIRA